MDNKWQYYGNDDVADEKEKRRVHAQGVNGEKEIEKVREIEKTKPGMFTAKQNAVDPRQFAEMLGMPFCLAVNMPGLVFSISLTFSISFSPLTP